MDDVKPDVTETPGEIETPAPVTPQAEPTPEGASEPPKAPERTVPLDALRSERKARQEAQRRLAEIEQQLQYGQYDPNDTEAVLAHPLVQDLLLKQAKTELTEFAKDELEKYPTIPETVKKAILKNVRGFVKETTTDIENAKYDIIEYIEGLMDELGAVAPQAAKTFPVAATNAPTTETPVRPAEVQKVLDKPVDDWSPEEEKLVDSYLKTTPKK